MKPKTNPRGVTVVRRPSNAPEGIKPSTWEGVLSVNPRGFGFVASAGQDDVYIPPEAIGGALHGDRVRVRVVAHSSRGVEGRIEDVLGRRALRVAGVLRKRRSSAWLEPDDSRIRGPIVLTTVPKEGHDGDAAVVAINRYPESADESPEGELVSVLGVPGDPKVEVAKILMREGVEEMHTEGAMREAEAMAARLTRGDVEDRTDLRGVALLTIDPEDARDHDDAVAAERSGDGHRVWVAIADVAEYVQPGTALDREALKRGCTIYLPDRALPMLPAALAADVCSLLPERERLCLAVIADIDVNGNVTHFDVCEARMRAQAMLTYGSVARTLGFTELPPKSAQAEAFKKELRALDEVARKLRRNRIRRGALDFDLPEPKLILDPKTGSPIGVTRRAEDPGVKRAYQMIEELMILANELVAQWLGKRRSPAVYRVHGKPDGKKLDRLEGVAERLGAHFDMDEIEKPDGVSKWLRKIASHPKKSVLETLLLRSMKQAVYDITNVGHFGLASTAYVHFTSPIRRYPDVQVHRAVKRLLRGGKPDLSPAAIEALAASATESSQRERAAMDVEREVLDLYRALYMRDRIGDVAEGTVTAVTGGGLYVTLDDPFVDVLIRYESLGPDRYRIDEDELGVTGERSGDKVFLGDRLTVRIEDVTLQRRSVLARRVVPEKLLAFHRDEPMQSDRGRRSQPERGQSRREQPPQRGQSRREQPQREQPSQRGQSRREQPQREPAQRSQPPREPSSRREPAQRSQSQREQSQPSQPSRSQSSQRDQPQQRKPAARNTRPEVKSDAQSPRRAKQKTGRVERVEPPRSEAPREGKARRRGKRR
ncbi:MAG TPA: VacB/RNase II family 3'-5' exoribonuclease [Polyangiaceae bacterium]|jgi:ribonuclease R|nr:VacB/RNase II family 3'-5' exoribonuclease [Polyangiaceae bacterium]